MGFFYMQQLLSGIIAFHNSRLSSKCGHTMKVPHYGRKAEYVIKNGVKVRKNTPGKCSEPRRVCIVCRTTVIRKNDKCYESKICKACSVKTSD